MRPVVRYGLGFVLLAGLACAVGLVATAAKHTTSLLGPVFTPDGSAIVAARRESRAWVIGIGAEMLTPPAHVRITRDRYALVRIDRRTGAQTTLRTLPPSPLEGTWTRAYRGHDVGYARAALSWCAQEVEWQVSAADFTPEHAHTYLIASGPGSAEPAWREGPAAGTGDEPATLSGDDEVLALPGSPCVMLLNERGHTLRALDSDPSCAERPDPATFDIVRQYSRRAEIERVAAIVSMRERLLEDAKARGLGSSDAELWAIRELQRMGYYPRPPQLVAMRLSAAAARARREEGSLTPLFHITSAEFQVGLFPDIRAALDEPGVEIEYRGPYILHQQYSTSAALNELLAGGGDRFFVETDEGVAAIRLVPRRDATR